MQDKSDGFFVVVNGRFSVHREDAKFSKDFDAAQRKLEPTFGGAVNELQLGEVGQAGARRRRRQRRRIVDDYGVKSVDPEGKNARRRRRDRSIARVRSGSSPSPRGSSLFGRCQIIPPSSIQRAVPILVPDSCSN